MLGHLKPVFCNIQSENKDVFWLNYCSICASLRQQHSLPYSFALSNEITFILVAFHWDIQAEETAMQSTTQCPARVFLAQKKIFKHQITQISADLSMILAYIKTVDWYVDNPTFYKKIILKRLEKKFNKIFPKLSINLKNTIQSYIKITKENEKDFEKVQFFSGLLAKNIALEIAQKIENRTSNTEIYIDEVAEIFEKLGRIIGIADHLIDFETDLLAQQYNPIIENSKQYHTTYLEGYKKLLSDFYVLKSNIGIGFLSEKNPHFAQMLKSALSQLTKKIKLNTPKSIIDGFSNEKIVMLHNDCDCGGCDGCDCGGCDCSGNDCVGCDNCGNCCDCCNSCNICSNNGKKYDKNKV